MSNKILTKAKFKQWLQSKHPRTKVGTPNCCEACPIAKFLVQATGKQYDVEGKYYYESDAQDFSGRITPKWASDFIDKVDELGAMNESVSAKRALSLLR